MRILATAGLLLALTGFAQGASRDTTVPAPTDDGGGTTDAATRPQQVEVTNFPATQNVAGSVEVSNLPRRFKFVGITSQRFTGAGGWFAMNAACAATYSGSRMAFSDEIRTTVNPAAVAETAWLTPRPSIYAGPAGVWDETGSFFPELATLDCRSWTDSNPHGGGVVTPTGGIGVAPCWNTFAVACAAP